MPIRTQSLCSVRSYLEEQQSALSPLLPNDLIGSEDPIEVYGIRRPISDLPDGIDSTHGHTDEEIGLEDFGDVTRVERCANGTEAGQSSM
jgi:hypothetical protein